MADSACRSRRLPDRPRRNGTRARPSRSIRPRRMSPLSGGSQTATAEASPVPHTSPQRRPYCTTMPRYHGPARRRLVSSGAMNRTSGSSTNAAPNVAAAAVACRASRRWMDTRVSCADRAGSTVTPATLPSGHGRAGPSPRAPRAGSGTRCPGPPRPIHRRAAGTSPPPARRSTPSGRCPVTNTVGQRTAASRGVRSGRPSEIERIALASARRSMVRRQSSTSATASGSFARVLGDSSASTIPLER